MENAIGHELLAFREGAPRRDRRYETSTHRSPEIVAKEQWGEEEDETTIGGLLIRHGGKLGRN